MEAQHIRIFVCENAWVYNVNATLRDRWFVDII